VKVGKRRACPVNGQNSRPKFVCDETPVGASNENVTMSFVLRGAPDLVALQIGIGGPSDPAAV
jgi:hypothetical protein